MDIKSQGFQYRRATLNDVSFMTEFRLRMLGEVYGRLEDDTADELRKTCHDYFSRSVFQGDYRAWIAEDDGRPVGTGGMVLWKKPPTVGCTSGRLGYILNLYTIPELRGRGICTRLLHELIEEAKSLGLSYIHLHASEDGMNIYRRAGFGNPHGVELELKIA
ncbi:MAG: GNAT family N-acetyltransferase [Candidatus Aminicenantes bacterium]|nr:GNAT family N-acetyltransferase [Candidatus Aminicenantes bacterium]